MFESEQSQHNTIYDHLHAQAQLQQQEELKLEEEFKRTIAIGRQIKDFLEQSPGAAFRSMPVEKRRTRSLDEDISIAKDRSLPQMRPRYIIYTSNRMSKLPRYHW
jgi:hypothetical protein